MTRRAEDGSIHLFSRDLYPCLQARAIALRLSLDHDEEKERESEHIQLELRAVHRWVDRIVNWTHPRFRSKIEINYPGLVSRLEMTLPAIIVLAEAIEQARLHLFRRCKTLGTPKWLYPFGLVMQRKGQLAKLGWCDFQIEMLHDTVNQSTIEWMIATGKSQDHAGHEACTASACSRSNVDESTYRQAHVGGNCLCKPLVPDPQKVYDAIRLDHIPVIGLEGSGRDMRLAVHALSAETQNEYIAISHVWVDGIGGKTETGLNQCQVERLHALSCSLVKSGNPLFWVDSLCIPRCENDRKLYVKALDSIKTVYSRASHVLVLDKGIQRCLSNCSKEDLYAQIYLSGWMQRMWTYEEAILAKKLVFRLKDGFHTYSVTTSPTIRPVISVVFQSLASQLFRLQAPKDRLNVGHVYTAFRYRTTNAKQEEFLSVSGILGLETWHLVDQKGDARAKSFWANVKWIPFNVVLLQGPKLDIPGFRWAPKTMMFPSHISLDSESEGTKSECTEHGLVGSYLTVRLQTTLQGTASKKGSIFNVFVTASQYEHAKSPTVLRVNCVETWPSPPYGKSFDAILLADEHMHAPAPGAREAGIALYQQREDQAKGGPDSSYNNNLPTFEPVGRVLIERLRNEEVGSAESTIMFEGSSKAVMDAQGSWSIGKICIT